MKSLTEAELDLLLQPVQELAGARLQKVFFSGDHKFAFEFYLGKTYYWVVDLTATSPVSILLDHIPFKPSKKTAPLQLFIKAHFAGKRLRSIERYKEKGRVLQVEFAEGGAWEIKLFPHGQNFVAQSGEKSISFLKPKPEALRAERVSTVTREPRTTEQIVEEWLQKPPSGRKQETPTETLKGWVEKREALRAKLSAQLKDTQPEIWKKAGEDLKADPNAELPESVTRYLEGFETWQDKMEACFAQEKSLLLKQKRLEQRLAQIDKELTHPPSVQSLSAAPALKKNEGERTHYKTFTHRDYILWVGKSAADNLKLLRSAKAWYLWMHVKDEPGAHGIVRLNRGEQVSQRDLNVIGENFLRLSLSTAAYRRWKGAKVEIILAEVRHVRPIKGDRLGRVRYSESKSLTVYVP